MWLGSWPEVEGGGLPAEWLGLSLIAQSPVCSKSEIRVSREKQSPCMSFHLTLKGVHEELKPTDSDW